MGSFEKASKPSPHYNTWNHPKLPISTRLPAGSALQTWNCQGRQETVAFSVFRLERSIWPTPWTLSNRSGLTLRGQKIQVFTSKHTHHDRTCKRNPQTIHRRDVHSAHGTNLLSRLFGRNDRWTISSFWMGIPSVSKRSFSSKLITGQMVTNCNCLLFFMVVPPGSAFSLRMQGKEKDGQKESPFQVVWL